MKAITQNVIIFIITCFMLSGCSTPDSNNKRLSKQDILLTANLLLDSINMLDSADLVKINTKGCVGNCLPFETFSKLIQYEARMQKLGYYVEWNNETRRYRINK